MNMADLVLRIWVDYDKDKTLGMIVPSDKVQKVTNILVEHLKTMGFEERA